MSKRNHWYDYLWVLTALYLALGFFNILFAWLGLLCFFIPLIMASTFGTKSYCNKYCGRGQLFELIGNSWKLSPKRDIPSWLRSHTFRYGFLLFFTAMFVNMLVSTYLVFTHAIYFHQTVSLLWTFDVPWHWAYSGGTQPWVAQFAFGFYSIMLTSSILGIITLLLFKPRSWCVYCPMGTITPLPQGRKKKNKIKKTPPGWRKRGGGGDFW